MSHLPLTATVRHIGLALQTELVEEDETRDVRLSTGEAAGEAMVALLTKQVKFRGAAGGPVYVAVRRLGGEWGDDMTPNGPNNAVALGKFLLT